LGPFLSLMAHVTRPINQWTLFNTNQNGSEWGTPKKLQDHTTIICCSKVLPDSYFAFFIQNSRLSTRGHLVFKFLLSHTNCTIPLSYPQLQCDWRYSIEKQHDIIRKPTATFTIKICAFFPYCEKLVCSGIIGLEGNTIT
jgi:hypothetical protein